MTVGTTTVKYANFLFQSPDWGLNSASPEPGNSRVDPLDTLAFHSMFPLRKAGGICIYRRNIGDKRSNFPLQPPEWRLHSGFAGTGKIRRLLSWIHLHFTQCSPCEKQADIISAIDIVKHSPCGFAGGFAFIAGTSAINAQIFPCNLRIGASPLAPGHPQQRKYCLKGNTALRAVNFRVPPNGTLVTRDRI